MNISPRDPRWIGAWWLGYLAFGLGSIISAIPVMCFPKRFKQKEMCKNDTGTSGKEKIVGGTKKKNNTYIGKQSNNTNH